MNVYEAISERQSIRAFDKRQIPQEILERILRAGAQAPTARNEQLHRTIALTDSGVIQKLMPHQPHVGTAPCVLVVYFEGESRLMACGQSARVLDSAICLSYMTLAAVEEGIQGCWLGGFDADHVKKVIDLPESAVIVAMHTLGYPAGPASRPKKKEPSDLFEIR